MPSEALAKEGCWERAVILLRATRFAGFVLAFGAKQDALRSLGEGGLLGTGGYPASRYALRRICPSVWCEAGCPPKPWRRRAAGNGRLSCFALRASQDLS